MIKKQEISGTSADRAAQRSGESGAWVRKLIAMYTLLSRIRSLHHGLFDIPVTIGTEVSIFEF